MVYNVRIVMDTSSKPKLKRSTGVILFKTLMLFPYLIITSIIGAMIAYESTILTWVTALGCFALTILDVVSYVKRWEKKHMKSGILAMNWHPNGWILGTIQLNTGEIFNVNLHNLMNTGYPSYHESGVFSVLNDRAQVEYNGQLINCGFAIYGDSDLYVKLSELGFNIHYIESEGADVDFD